MADTNASHDDRVAAFLTELTDAISSHMGSRWRDAWLYQFLVIGAAIAGFASLAFGMLADSKEVASNNHYAIWAGCVGALTSVATILSQQLHCVRAVNWHDRMAVELDAIRLQLIYEYQSTPNPAELAGLSRQLRNVKLKMTAEWEKATSGPGPKLGDVSLHGKKRS